MAEKEKRIIEGYEERYCLRIGGTEVILAENLDNPLPYLVCDCNWNNPLGVDVFTAGGVSEDYVEILREFLGRADKLLADIEQQREECGLPLQVMGKESCVEGSARQDWNGKLLVVDAKYITPECRSAEHQLFLCSGGNGADPEARGTSVFGETLYTGEGGRWRRHQIMGVADPAHLPGWARQKLAERESPQEKTSIRDQLDAGKQAAAQTQAQPPRKKDDPAL